MKNWLKRNKAIWTGGLIGLIMGILYIYSIPKGFMLAIDIYSFIVHVGKEIHLCIDIDCFVPGFLIPPIFFIIIGVLIGFIIKKVRKK